MSRCSGSVVGRFRSSRAELGGRVGRRLYPSTPLLLRCRRGGGWFVMRVVAEAWSTVSITPRGHGKIVRWLSSGGAGRAPLLPLPPSEGDFPPRVQDGFTGRENFGKNLI